MEKLSGKLSLKLYELLPPPFSIKQEKFHEYWVDFYTSLKDVYEKDDFKKIYSIFEDTRYLTEFHIAVPPKDLERDIIYILYKIMTTMPIKNYLTQITACTIIHNFMMTNIRPQNLEIPWKPLYDFVYFIFLKDDLVLMNKGSAILVNVLNVISDLSPYFSEGSTPEIIQTLLPHISPRGSNSVIYMSFLSRFVPVFDSSYKEWFPNFIQEVKDAGNAERFCPLFRLIARIVHHNINDDFHYLVPLVMNSFSLVIINEFMPDFITVDRSYEFIDKTENHSILTSYVSEAVMVLCMSPSTKRAAVEEFTTIMNGARDLFHPSVSMNSPTMMFPFIYAFVSDLRYHFREVHREISFVPVESLPSQEEIHLILKPVVDLHLMMIHTLTQNDFLTLIGIIRIINELDPTTVYRYFEFAFQCIMLTDAECVAEQGWTVMTAVLIGLKNTPLFEQHIQELFELAVNNFFVVELQTVLMRFLYVVFSIFPFNKETAPPGLKNFPFELLSVNFMNAIIDACRSFPAIQGKYARVNSTLLRTISMVFHAYIMGASYEVLAAIQPILITILSDSTLMHSFPFFGVIYNYFFVIADDSLRKPILKQMKDLLSLNLDTLTTCNLIRRFIRSTSTGAKTKEEMQEALDFIMPYTKHPLSQVRKEAWYSIGNALFQEKKLCIVKPTKDILIPLSDFKFELFNFNFDQSEFVLPLADDIIGKIMNAKDPKSVTEILKETKQIIFAILNTTHEVIEGDSSNITPLFKKSPFYIEELIKPSVPVREKFFDLIIYLLDNYPDNVQILKATMRMLDGILSPILSNYTFDNSIELSFLKSLWSAYPLRNKYNIFELSHRIGFSYHRRAQYHHPICPGLIKVVNKIFILGFSKFTKIRTKACLLINGILAECSCLLEKELKRFLRDTKVSNVDELLDFLTYNGIFSILSHDENLLVPVLKYVCTQLNADDQETNGRLQSFIGALCSTIYPLGVPSQHSELWDTLLADLIDHVEKDAMKDRTLHLTVSGIICTALKFVRNVSDEVIQYLLEITKNCDEAITIQSAISLIIIMKRNKRQTNIEKPLIPIKVSEYPPYFHDGERILKGDTSPEALLASVTDEYFVMPLPENISALDKASNGWHRYSSTYVIKKMNFLKDSIIIEHLPAILESSINSIDEESVDSKPYFFLFWETVAHVIGPASLKYLYEMFDELFEEPLNEATATALSDFMQGYLVSFPYWEPEDILEFEKRILFPYIIISSQNPTVSDITEYVFLLCSSFIDARRLYPLIQFMFKNCDSSPEGNLTRRRLFEILMTVISWQCPSFYTSVDLLFNRFIVPYLENSHEYSTSQSSSIIYIFMSLIESTCIPTYSPKYSPELKETRAFLIDSFNNLIKNNDPTQKFYHQTLSVFLQYMDTSSLIAVESMMPIYLDNLENILIAINSSDISTEDILESSFSSFLLHPIFTQNVHFAVEIIQKVLKNFDILSPPMQLKMIQSFTDMLRTIVHSISKDDLKTLYELFLNLAKQTKNENVLLEIMAIIGLVLKFSDPVENMDKIEAASIIVVALLFDEVDQQVLRAFEILKEIVESSSNNQNIIKNVIQKFWAMNADHMLPQVAEQLSVYRLLISPSYIS